MASSTDIGNTAWVKTQVNVLINANQKCYDTCVSLRECYNKVRSNWRSTGTTDNVNYMEKLDANIDKVYSLVDIISDLGEYINKYIDDSIAASKN